MGPIQVFAVIAFLMGSVALVFSVLLFRTEAARRTRGVVVPGVVLGSQFLTTTRHGPSGPSAHFYPAVEFSTREGAVRRFTDSVGTNLRPSPGQRVRVWYDPEEPTAEPVIMNTARRFFLPGMFGLLGLVFVGVGVGIAIASVIGATP